MQYNQTLIEEQLRSREQLAVGWPWRLLAVSGLIFITTLAIYFGISVGFDVFLDAKIKKADADLKKLEDEISKEQREDFLSFYSQINNIEALAQKKRNAPAFFSEVLEKNTLKKVFFNSVSVNLRSKEAKIDGVADSYTTLSQQLEVFRQAKEISRVNLESAAAAQGEKGDRRVVFSLRLNFNI